MRAYEPAQEARAIDWRASAREGSLHIRERSGEVTLAWGTVVDASLSMRAGRNRSLGEAAQEAAHVWRGCLAPGDRWIDVDPAGRCGLSRGLDRALRVLPAHSALLVVGDFLDLPDVSGALLRTVARRLDCTGLVAGDPWREDFPLAGFVVIADLETGAARRFFVGARERARLQSEAGVRQRAILARLSGAGWRAGTFSEGDGGRALFRAFAAP